MIFEQIKEMIVKELKVPSEKILLESRITEDLGADSMDGVTLVMEIEEKFDISISDEELADLKTVQSLVDIIQKKQK